MCNIRIQYNALEADEEWKGFVGEFWDVRKGVLAGNRLSVAAKTFRPRGDDTQRLQAQVVSRPQTLISA